MNNLPILDLITTLPSYIWHRSNQLFSLVMIAVRVINFRSSELKIYLVSRMFWGRGSMYRNSFHLLVTSISLIGLITGLASQIRPATAQSEFEAKSAIMFDNDSLQQGASLQTTIALDPSGSKFQAIVSTHIVKQGENVKSIAAQYSITPDTVRWANIKLIGPFSNYLEPGWKLNIPKVNGILHQVKRGETLNQIVARTKGNLFEVREINELEAPDYLVEPGQQIFIPSGNPYIWNGKLDDRMLKEAFEDPLSHPGCIGYKFYGGFTGTHNGLDLAKGSGCPIRSVAPGIVKHAGWWGGGGGWTVIIDHGAGIETHYYHGRGEIWVKKGQFVSAGQNLLYMGTTGNSTGVHLHFTMFRNGVAVDPDPYIPYKKIYP